MENGIKNFTKNKTTLSYLALILVVFVWGSAPPLTHYLQNHYYSPSLKAAVGGFICCLCFLLFSLKNLKNLNATYFKVAVPTGIFYATASLLQKIGLQHGATSTIYAFLENLSCIVVPILSYLFIRKKPNALTIVGCVVCLASAFALTYNGEAFNFNIGVILCAIAGLFYGVNIAGTGAFAKKLDVKLYLMIQTFIEGVISTVVAIVLNFIKDADGNVIEPIKFSFDILPVLMMLGLVLISSVFCWSIRTTAMKYVDASVVAVIMPFSAVVTAIISVLFEGQSVTLNLIIGGVLGIVAILLTSFGDIKDNKKAEFIEENSEKTT